MRFIIMPALLFTWLLGASQQTTQSALDSLLKQLPAAREDTAKVKLLLSIAQHYNGLEPKQGFQYANTGLALAQKLQWQRGVANGYNCLGLLTHDTGNAGAAIDWYEKSYAINERLNAKSFMMANLSNMGRSYQRETNYTKAAAYYFKGLAIAEETGNEEQAALLGTNITSLYIMQEDYAKARSYALRTIQNGRAAGAQLHVAKAYELLGVMELQTKDTAAAKKDFDKALSMVKQLGNKMAEVSVLSNAGTAEADPEKQIRTFLQVQRLLDTIAPASPNAIINLANLGLNYYGRGMAATGNNKKRSFDTASTYYQRAVTLATSTHNPGYAADIQKAMVDLAEAQGNYKQALSDYRAFAQTNDSVFSQENKNKIAALESQHSLDLKNQQIANKELQLSNQRKTMWLLLSLLVFAVLLGLLLYKQSLERQRSNAVLLQLNSDLKQANQVKTKFFGILSHDLRSPVANLLNFLELQKRKPGLMNEAQIAAREEKLSHAANTLLDTMETMLLWSKGQMEHFKPEKKQVAATDLFDYLKDFFADVHGVDFLFVNNQNLLLYTDEHYLKTIMHNLTANAIKALHQTPQATITWKAWQEDDNVKFSIADNGPGVNNTQLKALYDETTSSGASHGLGLHIIRDLAKSIGCTVTLQPGSAQGTVFVLSI